MAAHLVRGLHAHDDEQLIVRGEEVSLRGHQLPAHLGPHQAGPGRAASLALQHRSVAQTHLTKYFCIN